MNGMAKIKKLRKTKNEKRKRKIMRKKKRRRKVGRSEDE